MKKLLFFTYDFPYPTNSGGKSRAYNMMKFGGKGFEIILFSFTRLEFKEEYKQKVLDIGVSKIYTFERRKLKSLSNVKNIIRFKSSIFKTLYYSSNVEKKLIDVITKEKVNIILFESLYTSYYLSQQIRELKVKQIYGTENIEYKNYQDYFKKMFPIFRIPFQLQVEKIKHEEIFFAQNADVTLSVTDEEAEYFKEKGAISTEVIPNGVDIEHFQFKQSKRESGKKILFIGNFSYFPNRDGILFFYNNVFKNLEGDYHLKIVGNGVGNLNINDTRVELVSFVSDIRESYYDADVFVSPIRIGGGSNFKVIEAMACGTPVIAHEARVKSLNLTPDEDLLVAKSAEEFKEKLRMLLDNDGLQGKLAKNARVHIEKNYSWQAIGKKLNTLLHTL